MNKKKILIMAGGTGGHIFPALVIADELSKIGWEILWLGTQNRMESSIVPQYGYNIKFIKVDGIKGNGFKKLIQAPFMILRATFQARKIIKKFKPDIALGMGGFVTGPGGVAAKTLNIPLVIHESNAVAGITNKLLAKISNVILQAFPGTIKNAVTVGNPIRTEIINADFSIGIDDDKDRPLNILVMGGSQGARVMNERVSRTLDQLQEFNILHQSGKNQSESTKKIILTKKQTL
ncbi:UDP-N-acetylglucosamine--N-acetylmuramyl-(pentapeptide) pyrophosphoryl-undecaprenol N-acetylglucosamine transferase [Paraphotobacterium marinum]|uniref:UDP-N-acetylglucosamine--N-acetylmuramyl- (pentapeptide) pyrophosphoryl-undecaprenol N-acetylglucosamine transferase n=1 Tax=Paraphotobacterium marinum TaxID=1755811 RepID=UPI0021F2D1B9|nr:UDP-N-acetylglucosamine--N-acetylmuramyl-(pentapeptide) pyrophosphoryl-undecaprenol N-acetylglucosamine transferase [Paraphotobacterium marinum]